MRQHFTPSIVAAARDGRYVRVRGGADHRFLGVWVVVVRDRLFVRSWNDKPGGWFRAFLAARQGAVQLAGRSRAVRVRGRLVRGERLLDEIDAGYAAKYTTAANRKYVRGFATVRRRATTLEFLPGSPPAAPP
jgi:hypothetical protein